MLISNLFIEKKSAVIQIYQRLCTSLREKSRINCLSHESIHHPFFVFRYYCPAITNTYNKKVL
jgi:hypothetical protein